MRTSDPRVFAIGEVALHRGVVYGLVAPGYEMAEALAKNLVGEDAAFAGSDMSAKLKLLGTDVATFGEPFQEPGRARVVALHDELRGPTRSWSSGKTRGSSSAGSSWATRPRTARCFTSPVGDRPLGTLEDSDSAGAAAAGGGCSTPCRTRRRSARATTSRRRPSGSRSREDGLTAVDQVKGCTRAGTGCGGCLPMVGDLLQAELKAAGRAVKPTLCEHFALTRQELFQIVAARRIRSFERLIAEHGTGNGCEICKPAAASIFASVHGDLILGESRGTLQDSNDRFLANIQKNGTYSVIPRVPAGEITPEQLIALGCVARKYELYAKITGGQRIDLLGARVEQLPTSGRSSSPRGSRADMPTARRSAP